MYIKDKSSEKIYQVFCVFWRGSVRNYLISAGYNAGLMARSDDECEVLDGFLGARFSLIKSCDGSDMLLHWILFDEFYSKGKDFFGWDSDDVRKFNFLAGLDFLEEKKSKIVSESRDSILLFLSDFESRYLFDGEIKRKIDQLKHDVNESFFLSNEDRSDLLKYHIDSFVEFYKSNKP